MLVEERHVELAYLEVPEEWDSPCKWTQKTNTGIQTTSLIAPRPFDEGNMKKILTYLGLIAAVDIVLLATTRIGLMPPWWTALGLVLPCALIGGVGGVVYCLRGVYLNACVRKSWDDKWQPWYYIRPVVSHLCGAVSFLFLRAGLILLEAQPKTQATDLGFLALAFIAGLNVDKFIAKIEDFAHATWGIEKSRTAKGEDS